MLPNEVITRGTPPKNNIKKKQTKKGRGEGTPNTNKQWKFLEGNRTTMFIEEKKMSDGSGYLQEHQGPPEQALSMVYGGRGEEGENHT